LDGGCRRSQAASKEESVAQYKYASDLSSSNDKRFDDEHSPGVEAPYPGIYRCVACGDEIAIAKGNKLPPQNHPQHTSTAKIKWRLAVMAQQK
jgi:hypothetical protein